MRPWIKTSLRFIGGAFALVFTAAGISYAAADSPTVLPTVSHDAALPQLKINGVQLHLKTQGDRSHDTVIALHGGPGNDYRHLLPLGRLSDEYHVVFYDQRGAGLSERVDTEEVSLGSLIEELHAIGEHFSPQEPFRIIGHSWGAMLGAAYLERHPDRISHLVMLEPGFLNQQGADLFLERINGGVPEMSFALLGAVWGLGFEALKMDGPDDDAGLDHFLLSLAMSDVPGNPMEQYYCGGKADPTKFNTWRMGVRSSIGIQTSAFNKSKKLTDYFVGKNAKEFPHRVLLVGSTCNTITGYEYQKQHQALFREAKLLKIKDAGHMMIEEKPEQILPIIRDYFAPAASAPDEQ